MQAVDDALLEITKACNSRSWGSDPMEDLLARLDQIKVDAAALQMPLYDAKVMLERAYVLQALGRGADMLPLAKQARARLLGDRMPSLGSFSQGYERSYYLDTFAKQAEAQIITGDHEGLLATCEEVIRDFETERYRVNSPFRQSALLNAVVIFYKWAAFAAFKLSRWDNMLEAIELIKARSAIHSRLLPETPDLSESALTKEFEDVSKTLELQGADADPDLVARRRHLWDLLSIARAHGASVKQMPALTLSAVQSALDEDEALIGYFWLSDDTLLVMAVDHQRFVADRVTLKPDELQNLNGFVKALQQLRGVSRGMDKALRRFADILLPPSAATSSRTSSASSCRRITPCILFRFMLSRGTRNSSAQNLQYVMFQTSAACCCLGRTNARTEYSPSGSSSLPTRPSCPSQTLRMTRRRSHSSILIGVQRQSCCWDPVQAASGLKNFASREPPAASDVCTWVLMG